MTTVAYRRQSLDRDNNELGIDRQLKECKRVAKARGLTIGEVITDNDVSASKHGRPGYNRLLKLMRSGGVTEVIILRIDRLLRLNDELEELIQLVETHPVKVITCEGEVDLSTPQGRLIARILVSVARSEMEVKSARHKLANRQRAENGLPHHGRRAFGFETDGMTLRESEAMALLDIGQKFVTGWSYNELTYYLNENGYRTTQGNKFYSVAVRQLLTRKRYAGIREYEGNDYPASWPAIFEPELWERIQYTMKRRGESFARKQPVARKYLLTGLLECGNCGHSMNGQTAKDRKTGEYRLIYRCNNQGRQERNDGGCGKVSRGAIPLEWWIRELIVYRLDTVELATLLQSSGDSKLVNKLIGERDALAARIESLLDDFTDGTLTKPEYIRARARLNKRLDAIEAELMVLQRDTTIDTLLNAGERVGERWNIEAIGWRRQLVGLLISKIVVNPGRSLPRVRIDGKVYYFDSELIDVRWII